MEEFPLSSWDTMGKQGRDLLAMKLSSDQVYQNREILNSEDDEEFDEELEEVEADENDMFEKQRVTNIFEAACKRLQKYNKNDDYIPYTSLPVSERGSLQSTLFHGSSLPESIDGGITEVEELMSLPVGFEKSMKMNQAMQRIKSSALCRIHKAIEDNAKRQRELEILNEESNDRSVRHQFCIDNKEQYPVRGSSFAVPYFKDRYGTPAPMNEESEVKVERGYLDLYTTKFRPWTAVEAATLTEKVVQECKKKMLANVNQSKKEIERKIKNYDEIDDNLKAEIETVNNQIVFLTHVPLEKIEVPSDCRLDWDEISAQAFDGYRTAEECSLEWRNYLHPSIHKGEWTEEEDVRIQELVSSTTDKEGKWDLIAQTLGTNRTGFQVFQRFVSFIQPVLTPTNWSAEDSKKLVDTISMLRVGDYIPWVHVSQHVRGYTATQLQCRWRHLDPDIVRGPFTAEEDYKLVKGLYMFGLNWPLICHFLPGRVKGQVMERFKRGLLGGLTYKPWKALEDKRIIENCSSANQRWRRLGQFLPKRDISEMKLRYYVIQFWQSLSKKRKMPPPLFPITSTVDPVQINKLREKLPNMRNSGAINSLLSKPTEDLKHDLKELERRQQEIKSSREAKCIEKLLKDDEVVAPPVIIKKPTRNTRGPRVPTWPERAITEFFLPGRGDTNRAGSYRDGPEAENVAVALGKTMQLHITEPTDLEEADQLPLGNFDQSDINCVNRLVAEGGADGSCGDSIPLIPPNSATIGGLRSLLVHKPKLKEMANKQFLFYQVNEEQLGELGPNEKEGLELIAKAEAQSDIDSTAGSEQDSSQPPKKKRRRAAAVALTINKHLASEAVRNPSTEKTPTLVRPTPKQFEELQQTVHPASLRSLPDTGESVEDIKAREDKMLFSRMLSTFFWPALFTVKVPHFEHVDVADNLVMNMVEDSKNRDAQPEEEDDQMPIPEPIEPPKWGGKFSNFDIEEQEKVIEYLESNLKQKRGRKRKQPNDNFVVDSSR